jgi:hypothetical protein
MNPIVGLRLPQTELQRVHRLQWMSLLIDQDEQEFVCTACEHAFGAATRAALSGLACARHI